MCVLFTGRRGGWQSPSCRAKPSRIVPAAGAERLHGLRGACPWAGACPSSLPHSRRPRELPGCHGAGDISLSAPAASSAGAAQRRAEPCRLSACPSSALSRWARGRAGWAPGTGLSLACAPRRAGTAGKCHEGRTPRGIVLREPGPYPAGMGLLHAAHAWGSSSTMELPKRGALRPSPWKRAVGAQRIYRKGQFGRCLQRQACSGKPHHPHPLTDRPACPVATRDVLPHPRHPADHRRAGLPASSALQQHRGSFPEKG